MKRLALLWILFLIFLNGQAQSLSFDSKNSTSSVSISCAYVALADDASAVFINPAGLVQINGYAMYVDLNDGVYSGIERSTRVAGALNLRRFVLSGGFYYGTDRLYNQTRTSLALAYTFLEGTVGSFLSGGLSIDYITESEKGLSIVGNSESSDGILTFSVGTMLRPMPVVSLAVSILNFPDVSSEGNEMNSWRRCYLWGASYFWREKLSILYEQEIVDKEVIHHYGFILKTSSPIELMSGFSNGRVAGGLRWRGSFFNVAFAFISNKNSQVTYSMSVEIMRKGKDSF